MDGFEEIRLAGAVRAHCENEAVRELELLAFV
jgi:hypothetical protein